MAPEFNGYGKFSVWNKEEDTRKGHGGITVLIKEKWDRFVQLLKVYPNKQYIWVQIITDQTIFSLVTC